MYLSLSLASSPQKNENKKESPRDFRPFPPNDRHEDEEEEEEESGKEAKP